MQHGQDVIDLVPRELVLCLVLFRDELQKTFISCYSCSKIIPTVGVKKLRSLRVSDSILLPHRSSTKTSNGNTFLLYDHCYGCQFCTSGRGGKERTKEPPDSSYFFVSSVNFFFP